jgi:ATP-dependent Lon protease
LEFLDGFPFPVARVQLIEESKRTDPEIDGRAHTLRQRAFEIVQLLPQVPEEMVAAFQAIEDPGQLADFIAGLMDIAAEDKQALLETFDLKTRLDKLLDLLAHRIEVLKVSREIDERTRASIGEDNRKHSAARADARHPEGAMKATKRRRRCRAREGHRRRQDASPMSRGTRARSSNARPHA